MPETPRQLQDAARECGRTAADHLPRINGAQGLQAAVLALLLPAGSRRAARGWQIETQATAGALTLREHIGNLPPAARLPGLEVLLVRLRGLALATRQALLEGTRRVKAARGTVRPIDRLHWLLMRQRLGQASAASAQAAAQSDLSRLPATDVLAEARYCAFLSRRVPVEAPDDANATDVTAGDTAAAADALRLSCALLESALPPELERHCQGAGETLRS